MDKVNIEVIVGYRVSQALYVVAIPIGQAVQSGRPLFFFPGIVYAGHYSGERNTPTFLQGEVSRVHESPRHAV
jgi:hypothetical protein